jgi:hypothetical protein
MEYLTWEQFRQNAEENIACGTHWKNYKKRWKYFKKSINIVKSLDIESPKEILEIGTMGAPVVIGCDTLDYAKRWDFKGKNPTYLRMSQT